MWSEVIERDGEGDQSVRVIADDLLLAGKGVRRRFAVRRIFDPEEQGRRGVAMGLQHQPVVPQQVAESALRRDLVDDELELVDGRLALPRKPGLGIELNRDALERFADTARWIRSWGSRTKRQGCCRGTIPSVR